MDLVGDGMALARVGNRADDEEIGKRGDFAQVKDAQVRGFF
jgi:hypothetical protein